MSRRQALTMIIASIAMEELALSRILDAGGKQLDRLLCTPCTETADVLKINRSITKLLESIRQNQALLKGKLEAALTVECPCEPPCPCRSCPPSCRKLRPSIRLSSGGPAWSGGDPLAWMEAVRSGNAPVWDHCTPALVRLDPAHAYLVRYRIRLAGCEEPAQPRWISLRTDPAEAFCTLPPRWISPQLLHRGHAEVTDSGVLLPQGGEAAPAGLFVCLSEGVPLRVEQAELWVEEFF